MRSEQFIVISQDGEIDSHAPGSGAGDYVTLCGMDGNDPEIGQITLDRRAKYISCPYCLEIWKAAKELKASDFKAIKP